MIRWAKVRTSFTFLHRYPTAPPQVKYLRDLHRHKFHVTVKLEQFHNDRDIEYLMFLDEVEKIIEAGIKSWPSSSSCESMAESIGNALRVNYANRLLIIEVSEDGENGAELEWPRG